MKRATEPAVPEWYETLRNEQKKRVVKKQAEEPRISSR